jgi:hypothetical protein
VTKSEPSLSPKTVMMTLENFGSDTPRRSDNYLYKYLVYNIKMIDLVSNTFYTILLEIDY